jgi:hypothetical protein
MQPHVIHSDIFVSN